MKGIYDQLMSPILKIHVNLLPLLDGFKQVGGTDVEIRVLVTVELKLVLLTMH